MHVIRLRKPWTRTPLEGGEPCRVDVPDEAPMATTRVCYQRNFNQPSGLGEGDRVDLVVMGFRGKLVSVRINEHPMGVEDADANQVSRWDITPHLSTGNQVRFQLEQDLEEPPRLSGDVRLEISDGSVLSGR